MWFDNLQIIRTVDDLIDALNNVITAPTAYPGVSADDGNHLSTNFFYAANNDIPIGNESNYTNNGAFIRFTNVAVPQGAVIASAKIRLRSFSAKTGTVAVRIKAVAADNPDAPTTASGINSATKTTAYVDWSPADWSQDVWCETPDIGSVIQEIVDRAGWASGNALIAYIGNNGTAYPNFREFYAYDYSTGLYKPELIVSYIA